VRHCCFLRPNEARPTRGPVRPRADHIDSNASSTPLTNRGGVFSLPSLALRPFRRVGSCRPTTRSRRQPIRHDNRRLRRTRSRPSPANSQKQTASSSSLETQGASATSYAPGACTILSALFPLDERAPSSKWGAYNSAIVGRNSAASFARVETNFGENSSFALPLYTVTWLQRMPAGASVRPS
jgi:hypothetical protein